VSFTRRSPEVLYEKGYQRRPTRRRATRKDQPDKGLPEKTNQTKGYQRRPTRRRATREAAPIGSNRETPPEAVLPGEIVPNQRSIAQEELEEDLQEDVIPRAVPSRAHRNKSSFKTKCQLAEAETADEDHSATQCCNEILSTFFPLILISSHFDKNLFI